MKRKQARRELIKDILLIVIGVFIAIALNRMGFIDSVVHTIGNTAVVSFIVGIFFTSVFTLAPASVALARIAETGSVPEIALWGALGAMCGDLILFFFIRDHFMDNLMQSMRPTFVKHVLASFHFGFLKWISPIVGAIVIASPLPDEFGVMLMGMSKVRMTVLMPISFAMNWLGIYLLVWAAHVL